MFDQMQTRCDQECFVYVQGVFNVSINVVVLLCELSYFDSNYEYDI